MKVRWGNEPADPGTWDLCGTHQGRYVDVVKHVDGTWAVYYSNECLEQGLASRETARVFVENLSLKEAISRIAT